MGNMVAAGILKGISDTGKAFMTVEQGKAEEQQLKYQAKSEGMQAREAAIARRERLIDALAQQNARVGASGAMGTSFENIRSKDIKDFEREDVRASSISKTRQKFLKDSGKFVRRMAKRQAHITLMSDVADSMGSFGGSSGGGSSGG